MIMKVFTMKDLLVKENELLQAQKYCLNEALRSNNEDDKNTWRSRTERIEHKLEFVRELQNELRGENNEENIINN